MEKRIRITKLIVLPVVFLDDGENLVEIETEPLEVPASEIGEFVESGLKKALQGLATTSLSEEGRVDDTPHPRIPDDES